MTSFFSNFNLKASLKILVKFFCVLLVVVFLPFGYICFSNFTFNSSDISPLKTETALVLGAQVYSDIPSVILSFRLDASAELYQNKKITKILVSGDNWSDKYYNEPKAMKSYLVKNYSISETSIFEDYAGLNTFDSCWRAKNVFNLQKIYLVTQAFHMQRALYLCRNVGLTVIPVVARDSNINTIVYGFGREVLASWKAILNIASDREPPIKSDGTEPQL